MPRIWLSHMRIATGALTPQRNPYLPVYMLHPGEESGHTLVAPRTRARLHSWSSLIRGSTEPQQLPFHSL